MWENVNNIWDFMVCSAYEMTDDGICFLQAIAEQNYEVLEDWTYEAVSINRSLPVII